MSAETGGPPAPGVRLRLEMRHPRGRTFWTAPTLTDVDPGRRLEWMTSAFGFRSPTALTVAPHETGSLVVLTSESRGPLAFTYRLTFPEKTQGLVWSGTLTALAADLAGATPGST